MRLQCKDALSAWNDVKYRFNNKLFKNGALIIKYSEDELEVKKRIPCIMVREFVLDHEILVIEIDEMKRQVKEHKMSGG